MHGRLVGIIAGANFAVMVAGAMPALALDKPDGFPDRTLTILTPFSIGGGGDSLARAMAQALEPIMEVSVRVVNQPGAGGVAGTSEFMTMPADGYTILQQSESLLTAITGGRIDVAWEDFTPICLVQVAYSQIYMATDQTKFSDWPSFVEYAEANGAIMANDSGIGSMEHVASVALAQGAGIEIEQVNTAQFSERTSYLLGGTVDIMFEQPGPVAGFLESGLMQPILTLLQERAAEFPDVPSFADVGLDDIQPLLRTRGLFVKRDVPEERKRYLEAACRAAYDSEGFQEFNKAAAVAAESFYGSDEAAELFAQMAEVYLDWYERLGITGE